jgi:hypothetical protein
MTVGFECITNNSAASAAIGEAQFWVDIVSGDPGEVMFVFRNTGPLASTIAEVYFDSGPLNSITDIINPSGVNFVVDGSPGNLPGGHSIMPPFETTPGLMASAANPAPHWGVNHFEQTTIVCSLLNGLTWADVAGDIASGDLRIGIHGISMADGGDSESFVNTPEPATLAVMALGFLGLRAGRRHGR